MLRWRGVFLPMMGMRPDFGAAMMQAAVMVKQAVPVLLALGAFGAALRLARPGGASAAGRCVLAAAPALLALAVAARADGAAAAGLDAGDDGPEQRPVRRLHQRDGAAAARGRALGAAPRRQHPAGAQRCAGGAAQRRRGGGVYSIHCTEDSPLFYAVWYMLAILGADRARRAPRIAAAALVGAAGFFLQKVQ